MTEQDLKLDARGNVDVDYYVKLARQQRNQYMGELGAAFASKVKALFRVAPPRMSTSH
ncbi:RSP_7527 family protein [Marinobacter fonticola]|uniref:RSP_7527 family protein n=1 Tax=Marinobacter fonticola TaxID=2603215 RepID=UPI00143D086D|nr:hypothetical protein [Marinobacter fonticola]